jgi:tripartite-type tricarboxylate transporter receptor subunit TctC
MIAMRRRLLVLPVTGILPGLGRAQSTWPAGPVRLVVPFPAGGPTDIVARPLAQMLAEALRQSVVVDKAEPGERSVQKILRDQLPTDNHC